LTKNQLKVDTIWSNSLPAGFTLLVWVFTTQQYANMVCCHHVYICLSVHHKSLFYEMAKSGITQTHHMIAQGL